MEIDAPPASRHSPMPGTKWWMCRRPTWTLRSGPIPRRIEWVTVRAIAKVTPKDRNRFRTAVSFAVPASNPARRRWTSSLGVSPRRHRCTPSAATSPALASPAAAASARVRGGRRLERRRLIPERYPGDAARMRTSEAPRDAVPRALVELPEPGPASAQPGRQPGEREQRQRQRRHREQQHHQHREREPEQQRPRLGRYHRRECDRARAGGAEGQRAAPRPGGTLQGRGSELGQVVRERVELRVEAGPVDRVHPCRQLLVGEPAGRVVAIEEVDGGIAVGIRDTEVRFGEEEHGGTDCRSIGSDVLYRFRNLTPDPLRVSDRFPEQWPVPTPDAAARAS